MDRRLFRYLLASVLYCALIAVARSEVPQEKGESDPESEKLPDCIDAVVIARVLDTTPEPIPALGPDVIVMRWPWAVDIDVQRVLLGDAKPGRMQVRMSLHAGINDDVRYVLFFLRGKPGQYVVTNAHFYIIKDRRGRFWLPFAEPAVSEWIAPEGWLPHDYEARLEPINYRARDAWWMKYDDDESENLPDEEKWVVVKGGRRFAKRGLLLDDMEALIAERQVAPCHRPKPCAEGR